MENPEVRVKSFFSDHAGPFSPRVYTLQNQQNLIKPFSCQDIANPGILLYICFYGGIF